MAAAVIQPHRQSTGKIRLDYKQQQGYIRIKESYDQEFCFNGTLGIMLAQTKPLRATLHAAAPTHLFAHRNAYDIEAFSPLRGRTIAQALLSLKTNDVETDFRPRGHLEHVERFRVLEDSDNVLRFDVVDCQPQPEPVATPAQVMGPYGKMIDFGPPAKSMSYWRFEITLSRRLNLAPVRILTYLPVENAADRIGVVQFFDEHVEIDGRYWPKRIRTFFPGKSTSSAAETNVDRLVVNDPSDYQDSVTIPAGTYVLDERSGKTYVQPAAGTEIEEQIQATVKVLKARPLEKVSIPPELAAQKKTWSWWWLIGGALAMASFAGVRLSRSARNSAGNGDQKS